MDADQRIKELEIEVAARDRVLNRFGVMDVQQFCRTCISRHQNCRSVASNCIPGMIAYAKAEIEKEQNDD